MRLQTVILAILCIIAMMFLILTISAINVLEPYAPEVNNKGLAHYEVHVQPEPTCGRTASESAENLEQLPSNEVLAMAQAMYGECYESEYQDMLRVGMAICNRVDDPRFPTSVAAVCAQPGQIHGYNPYSQPAEICLQAAREVLDNWYAIKAGEARPWEHGIKYWTAGGGMTNVFREEY